MKNTLKYTIQGKWDDNNGGWGIHGLTRKRTEQELCKKRELKNRNSLPEPEVKVRWLS